MHILKSEVIMAEPINQNNHQKDQNVLERNSQEINSSKDHDQSFSETSSSSSSSRPTSMQNALGLNMSNLDETRIGNTSVEWPKSRSTSDISRTPSQSTTGTSQSQNSLETAASSLQSAVPATSKKEILLGTTEKALPLLPPDSPLHFVTACSTPAESGQVKQEEDLLKRYHALLELVDTERSYAEDLEVLVSTFFSNLTKQTFFEESEKRTTVVIRNATKLVELHSSLLQKWESVLDREHLHLYDQGTTLEKAIRCGNAIESVVEHLREYIPHFQHYKFFCSRHSEAMVMIREAERRRGGDEYVAYERMCGNLIRTQSRASSSTPNSRRHSLSRQSSGILGPLSPSGLVSNLTPMEFTLSSAAKSPSSPSSGSTTPSTTYLGNSMRSLNSHRLLLADYLIKPIQRMCLYPLVLNSLQKYTPPQEMQTKYSIELAIEQMRALADEVDEASRIREKDLMAELILTRIESTPMLPQPYLQSLGAPQLSGTLDVLHHHSIEDSLSVPLRFHRLGVVMWTNFLLIVRTRKNGQLECRYWMPLNEVDITPKMDTATYEELRKNDYTTSNAQQSIPTMEIGGKTLVPNAFRLSFRAHHFEFSASTAHEKRIWHDALRLAIDKNNTDSKNSTVKRSVAPSNLSSTPGMTNGADAISSFFAANIKSSNAGNDGIESLIKLPSSSTRATVDRNMVFSDVLIAPAGLFGVSTSSMQSSIIGGTSINNTIGPSTVREISEALIAHQLRQSSAPSIGSAVGAAMGFAKMAATQMPTVKRPRRMSSLTPLDFSTIRPPLTSTISEASVSSSSGGSNSTPKRSSLTTLPVSEPQSANSDYSNRRFSSPVDSLTSRVRGSLSRANSLLSGRVTRSTSGSLPTSPMASTVDLGMTTTQEQIDENSKTLRSRTKSISFREAWNKRTRSQSAQLPVTMGPSYESFTTINQYFLQPDGKVAAFAKPIPTNKSSNYFDDENLASPIISSSVNSQMVTSESPSEIGTSASSYNPSTRYLSSAPSSQSSSRRQSVASIFTSSYTDLQRTIQTPLRNNSPVTHVREGAANTLRRAKSAAKNRLSMNGGSFSLLTSPTSSLVAKPVANNENAKGYFQPAAHRRSISNDDESCFSVKETVSNEILTGTLSNDGDSSLSRSNTAVDRLRGSLSRNASTRTAKGIPSPTHDGTEVDNFQNTKDYFNTSSNDENEIFSKLEEDFLQNLKTIQDYSPQMNDRFPLPSPIQEAGESIIGSSEQSRDDSYTTAYDV